MPIADDFSVATNGDIRHVSGTATYTVLELHRFLQDLADDAQASGNDLVDITTLTPSDRSTDAIITLLNGFNIDDTAAEYLYGGSITQNGGDTVYSGLQVLGAVNNASTQLMVIQDNALYQFTTTPSAPFWGDQSAGGLNGNSTAGILMRCLIKSRVNGHDIDGKKGGSRRDIGAIRMISSTLPSVLRNPSPLSVRRQTRKTTPHRARSPRTPTLPTAAAPPTRRRAAIKQAT
jgi:hypothetical protein